MFPSYKTSQTLLFGVTQTNRLRYSWRMNFKMKNITSRWNVLMTQKRSEFVTSKRSNFITLKVYALLTQKRNEFVRRTWNFFVTPQLYFDWADEDFCVRRHTKNMKQRYKRIKQIIRFLNVYMSAQFDRFKSTLWALVCTTWKICARTWW